MVHVSKCPYGHRGKASTEFYKNGKPQIYCLGWIDPQTDETIEICKKCKDFVEGEQMQKDFEEMVNEMVYGQE